MKVTSSGCHLTIFNFEVSGKEMVYEDCVRSFASSSSIPRLQASLQAYWLTCILPRHLSHLTFSLHRFQYSVNIVHYTWALMRNFRTLTQESINFSALL